MNYNQSYSGISTADFNANPQQQYVALQFGEYNTEQFTYYGKLRAELNSNITNTTTLYYNYFTRDWFKFDKAGETVAKNLIQKLTLELGEISLKVWHRSCYLCK